MLSAPSAALARPIDRLTSPSGGEPPIWSTDRPAATGIVPQSATGIGLCRIVLVIGKIDNDHSPAIGDGDRRKAAQIAEPLTAAGPHQDIDG